MGNRLQNLIDLQRKRMGKSFTNSFVDYMVNKECEIINKAVCDKAREMGVSIYNICFNYVPMVRHESVVEDGTVKMQFIIDWMSVKEFDLLRPHSLLDNQKVKDLVEEYTHKIVNISADLQENERFLEAWDVRPIVEEFTEELNEYSVVI